MTRIDDIVVASRHLGMVPHARIDVVKIDIEGHAATRDTSAPLVIIWATMLLDQRPPC